MTDDEAQYSVKLVDDASKPAGRVANGYERIAASARETERAVARLNRIKSGPQQFRAVDANAIKAAHSAKVQAKWDRWRSDQQAAEDKRMARNRAISESYAVQKRFRDEAAARRKALQQAYDDNKFSTKRMLGLDDVSGRAMEGMAKNALVGAAVGAGIAAAAVGKLTYEIVQGTAAAMRFADAATTGLTLITGDANEANSVFVDAVRLSDRLGTSWQTSVSGMQKLLGKGFSRDGAEDLIKATSDLAIVAPDANIDNLLLAIGQIKTAGKLQGDELNQLTEAGLNSELMFTALEKRLGKTRAEILKMKEQGQLMAEPVLESIKDSVKAMTGRELGKASEEASFTLAGMFRRLEGLPERFFLDVAKKADRSGFTATLEGLWKSMGPGSPGFSAAVDGAVRVFDLVVAGAQTALPIIRSFVSEFAGGLVQIQGAGAGADVFAQWRDPEFIASVGKLGSDLGKIAGAIVAVGEAALRWWPTISRIGEIAQWVNPFTVLPKALWAGVSLFTGGDDKSAQMAAEGTKLGKSFGQGMAAGINSSMPGVDAASRGLGNAALVATRDVTDTHSPSRKMMDIGWDQGAGFALGMDYSAPMVTRAANDMGGGAITTAASSLPPISRGAAVTNNNSTSMRMGAPVFSLTIEGNADANTVAELERMVDRKIEQFFDRAASQGAM